MSRRGENIFKRKDGRWEARVPEYKINGEKIYRSIYGKSYTDVKLKKEEYYSSVSREKLSKPLRLTTFADIADYWLTTIKGTVKESSFTRYHRNVHSYLNPAIGNLTLSEINSNVICQLKDELLESGGKRGDGLSEKTVSDLLSTLKMILMYAEEQGYPVMNAELIRNPKKKKREVNVIPGRVVSRLEEILLSSGDRISLGILLTLHTGIRNGELCGLRWGDFDFSSGTIRISRTVERIRDLSPLAEHKTKIVITEPKTDSSKREIPLPKTLCLYLRSHSGATDEYLLTGTDKPSEPHTLYVRYERFLRRNGFESYTFHAIRHTFATRGIASGFDAKSLSEILGHSDVTTTLRCYVHPSMDEKRNQMETLFNAEIRGQKYGT